MSGDLFLITKWWLYILLIGVLFLPLTQKYFRPFFDKGYGFSKVVGILVLSYSSWLLTSLGVIGSDKIYSIAIPLALIPIAAFMCKGSNILRDIKENIHIILFEELLFMGMLFLWCYVRGLQPDIYGLEKYMDFGFVNAILRADSMPPIDIWFAGKGINYYYFGHYICAYLIKLSGIEPAISYNLMIATLFSLSFLLTFSLASNLLYMMKRFSVKKLMIAGLIAASLLSFGGNLHSFLYGYGVLGDSSTYYYPNSTRYIGYNPSTDDKTIHEFPTYSFIVSDLHGHVSDIPTVLTFMAIILGCFTAGEGIGHLGFGKVVLLGFLLSTIYMTNTWDYPIYITVLAITMLYRHTHIYFNTLKPTNPIIKTLAVVLAAIALSQVFALPYSLKFEGISAGVGLVHYRTPLYQMAILWGYQLFYVLCFTVFLIISTRERMKVRHKECSALSSKESWLGRLVKNIAVPDMLCLIICCCGLGLLLIPEIVYVTDIYSSGYHRANTMFKLTYQAFIMFCIVAGYIVVRIPSALRNRSSKALTAIILLIVYLLPMSYFPLALKGYYTTWKPSNYKGIDGLQFLESKHPEDYGVIEWLNANVNGQPTILEAHGDSYTNYGRISMSTGLPTVQGWFVHEWLWRNDKNEPLNRGKEVQTVYESQDIDAVWDIIRKYDIQYIIVGDLEREKFVTLNEEKLVSLGEVVFESGNTKVIRVR
jgi:YYY domain-containing protein